MIRWVLLLLALLAPGALAQRVDPVIATDEPAPKVYAQPAVAADADFPLLVDLQAEGVQPEEVDGKLRVGQTRRLSAALQIRPLRPWAGREDHEPEAWRGRLRLRDAAAVRVHFRGAGVLWVRGSDESEFRRFEASPAADWSPTTRGESVDVIVENAAPGFAVTEVAELTLEDEAAKDLTCTVNASCYDATTFDAIALARKAVARIVYQSGTGFFVCSGGLITDVGQTQIPYFLTANHCVSTAAEAASIEARWGYAATTCTGAATTEAVTTGAQLLFTSANTDVTLLKMNSIPSGRVFLGFDVNPVVTAGTILHRVSHPEGSPQKYSQTTVITNSGACSTIPRPRYVYSMPSIAFVSGGSSGSPVMLAGGYIVGQLYGRCGTAITNNCSPSNMQVDGALSQSWPDLARWLGCNGSAQVDANGCITKVDCLTGRVWRACP